MKDIIFVLSAYLLADGAASPIAWRAFWTIAAIAMAKILLLSMQPEKKQ